jgi:Flp pilus assembly protein TadG
MRRLHLSVSRSRLARDERGMFLIVAGVGLVAFMAATMLALDVGMFMSARTQAQNAADAGALAGATALYYDDYDDRSAGGPAVQNAIAAATSDPNSVMNTKAYVGPGDVTFPTIDRVRVVVHRTGAHGNPLRPFIAPLFGIDEVDLRAEATAEAQPANAMTCVKPFTIPDKWEEKQTPPWDPNDTFDVLDKHGNPLPNPDVYRDPYHARPTGYSKDDFGTRVVIKAANGNNLYPSFYFPYSMGGITGSDYYRENIAGCNDLMMGYKEPLMAEPGNQVGPTQQGVQDLIAQDPHARWDPVEGKVISQYSPSPRVAPIPVFDPMFYETGKQNGRNADLLAMNYIGIFIERMQGNDVIAVVVPIAGVLDGDRGPAPAGAVPKAIVLVK